MQVCSGTACMQAPHAPSHQPEQCDCMMAQMLACMPRPQPAAARETKGWWLKGIACKPRAPSQWPKRTNGQWRKGLQAICRQGSSCCALGSKHPTKSSPTQLSTGEEGERMHGDNAKAHAGAHARPSGCQQQAALPRVQTEGHQGSRQLLS